MMKKIMLLIFLGISMLVNAQKSQYLDLSVNYTELKDQTNYGLVFRGPNLLANYIIDNQFGPRRVKFESEFGFGVSFSRGIVGINFNFKPAQLKYLFEIPTLREISRLMPLKRWSMWIG
jgi:hypothetical protein